MFVQMGTPLKSAASFMEMFRGLNEGIVVPTEPRSAGNTTPTSFETFAKQVFVPSYQGRAAGA